MVTVFYHLGDVDMFQHTTSLLSVRTAISGLMQCMRMALFLRCNHLLLLPLGLAPVTQYSVFILGMCFSVLRITCPCHEHYIWFRNELMGVNFRSPLLISFLTLRFWYVLDCTVAFSFPWCESAVFLVCPVPNTQSHTL